MNNAVIVAATRTAIGKFQGSLAKIKAAELGAATIRQLLHDTQIRPGDVDEVIMGHVLTAGEGQNTARQAALSAGLPNTVSAMTINKVCGSGLKAVQLAAQAIQCGDAEVIIAGGQENMSLAAHVLPQSRTGQRMGNWSLVDSMITDGLWCAFNNYHMGQTAENIANQYTISREAQDEFALKSQSKASKALSNHAFASEITPIAVPQRRGDDLIFDKDEYPRQESTIESFQGMRPAFAKEGSVTAANASGLNDGAASVLVMSAEKAHALKLPILAHIKSAASAGVDPAIMGTGPIPAVKKCLEKAQWNTTDLDLIEANEAFAAQALAVNQSLAWDPEIINVNGGAIALGHPIGASGCRILVSLIHEMIRRDAKKGLATLCIGGGMGIALAIERE